MENEKFQELMLEQFAKLTNQIQEVNTKLSGQIQEIDTKLTGQIHEVRDIQLRMENNLTEKAKGLYEFVAVQRDANKDIVERLDRIEAKVEVLQLETAHIRRVK